MTREEINLANLVWWYINGEAQRDNCATAVRPGDCLGARGVQAGGVDVTAPDFLRFDDGDTVGSAAIVTRDDSAMRDGFARRGVETTEARVTVRRLT
jgi:hypothetical protein